MQRDFSVVDFAVGFYVCLFSVFFFAFAFVCLIAYFDLFPYRGCGRDERRTRVTRRRMELGCMM